MIIYVYIINDNCNCNDIDNCLYDNLYHINDNPPLKYTYLYKDVWGINTFA